VNISIPVPIPGQENGLQLSLKFQIWKPKRPSSIAYPALHELAATMSATKASRPQHRVGQIFGSMPGMSDHLGKMVEEFTKGGNVSLHVHWALVPGWRDVGTDGAKGLPPCRRDQPLVEVNFDLKELSTGNVPTRFQSTPATRVPWKEC